MKRKDSILANFYYQKVPKLPKFQSKGQVNIPGITNFKMPRAVSDNTRLPQRNAELENNLRVEEMRQKQGQVKQSRPNTVGEEKERLRKIKNVVSQLPNVRMDEQTGTTSAINPNMTYEGQPANFMGKRQQKSVDHILGALDAAGYVTGASELGQLGYNALKNLLGKSMKPGLISNSSKVFPKNNLSKNFITYDGQLIKLPSSEKMITSKDFFTKSEVEEMVRRNKEISKGWDDLYEEYEKVDPNMKPIDIFEIRPDLKEEADRLKEFRKKTGSFQDKFLTPELDKYVRQFENDIDVRQFLSNSELKRFAKGLPPHNSANSMGLDPMEILRMSDGMMEKYDGIPSLPGIYPFNSQNTLKNLTTQFEKGKLNRYGGNISMAYGGPMVRYMAGKMTGPNIFNRGGMITDPRGQWAHPGKNTRIPGGNITMQGVPYPVLGKANNGQSRMMYPGQDYSFPGADYVDEYPMMQNGGYLPMAQYGCHGKSCTQTGEGMSKVGGINSSDDTKGGTGYFDWKALNTPVGWNDLLTYNSADLTGKDLKQYNKDITARTKSLQTQFPGLTEDQLRVAGADSARIRQRMQDLPRYDQPSEQTYDKAYHQFYRPLMNQKTPVTVEQILNFQSQQPGGLGAFKTTVQSNYGRKKAQYGGPQKKHPIDLRLSQFKKPGSFFTGYGFSQRPIPNVDVHGVGAYGEGNVNDRLNLNANVNSASVFYPGGNKMFMNPRFEVGMKYKFQEGGQNSKKKAQKIVEIARKRIADNNYVEVPDDIKKASYAEGKNPYSCIGGVCTVAKEAGALPRVYWSNAAFAKDAPNLGFPNNGYGLKGIQNLEPGDFIQYITEPSGSDEEGNTRYAPRHAQIFLGVNPKTKEYEFFDNQNKALMSYPESMIKDKLKNTKRPYDYGAVIYKNNPFTPTANSFTDETLEEATNRLASDKKEKKTPTKYKYSIRPDAEDYNEDTKDVMNTFVSFANSDDKLNNLVSKLGTNKAEIHDSLLNVFGELGQENNWGNVGSGPGSRIENLAEKTLSFFGGGKKYSVGPGQIKFKYIPQDLKKKFNIKSTKDLYNLDKVIPLMVAQDILNKKTLRNWGEKNLLSDKLIGHTDNDNPLRADDLKGGVGRWSPYLRNEYGLISSGKRIINNNDWNPFNTEIVPNYDPTTGMFMNPRKLDEGSYPSKVIKKWSENLQRDNINPSSEASPDVLSEYSVFSKTKKKNGGDISIPNVYPNQMVPKIRYGGQAKKTKQPQNPLLQFYYNKINK